MYVLFCIYFERNPEHIIIICSHYEGNVFQIVWNLYFSMHHIFILLFGGIYLFPCSFSCLHLKLVIVLLFRICIFQYPKLAQKLKHYFLIRSFFTLHMLLFFIFVLQKAHWHDQNLILNNMFCISCSSTSTLLLDDMM